MAISGNKWPKQGNRRQEVQSADPNDKGSRGRTVEHPYTQAELVAFREGLSGLGLTDDQRAGPEMGWSPLRRGGWNETRAARPQRRHGRWRR